MIYLGTLGSMIGIKCPASQNVEYEERYSFQTTLEGRRKAQVRPRGPRTWSLQTSDATTPAQVATLMQFAQGAWGPGPFVFVPADAPATNMLTPAAASCAPEMADGYSNLSAGGPVEAGGVWFPRSLINSDPSSLLIVNEKVPVIPGFPVTGSAWVRGAGGRVRVSFYDQSDVLIGAALSTVTATAGTAKRSWVQAVAPLGASHARVIGVGTTMLAMPSLTWTDNLVPESDGQGCAQAVIHGVSRGLVLATSRATYSNVSFTVTEVG